MFNEVYARYFENESPARIFLHVPSWPGPFDVEVDCVALAIDASLNLCCHHPRRRVIQYAGRPLD